MVYICTMRIFLVCSMLFSVWGEQKCTKDANGVLRYNGLPCASTTHYENGGRGGCACGPRNSASPFTWNLVDFVAAANEKFFRDNCLFCGAACGACIQLTPTSGFVPGEGSTPDIMSPVTFMITDVCPVAGNEKWCSSRNKFGYDVHFNLQDIDSQIFEGSGGLHWDNPEVTWKYVSCSADQKSKYAKCECCSPLDPKCLFKT